MGGYSLFAFFSLSKHMELGSNRSVSCRTMGNETVFRSKQSKRTECSIRNETHGWTLNVGL